MKTRKLSHDDIGAVLSVRIKGIRLACKVCVVSVGDCGAWCRLSSIDCTDHAFCCGETKSFQVKDVAVQLPSNVVATAGGAALLLLAVGLLAAGCETTDWPNVPDVPDVPALTNLPPVQPETPAGLTAIKIEHGAESKMPEGVKGGEICNIGGTQLRFLVLNQLGKKDVFVTDAAKKAGAARVRDGKMVADDWPVADGVMVWQYWTLGTSKISAQSFENPVATKRDSRVWYRFCASKNGSVPIVPPAVPGDARRVAVCAGMVAVDPIAYDGWAGECPGADIDARDMHEAFAAWGLTSTLLMDKQVTWANWRSTVATAAAPLKAGDLLVLMFSGHGGQLADNNGDEADGQDETLCLWDGQVRDDEVLKFLKTLPPGLRIVLFNDQCHSEGNFRAFTRQIQRSISLGRWGKVTARVLIEKADAWNGQLIQFAGCREAAYSYGSTLGGTWTQTLLTALPEVDTWRGWYDAAAKLMPAEQVPAWSEYGAVQETFRKGPVLK